MTPIQVQADELKPGCKIRIFGALGTSSVVTLDESSFANFVGTLRVHDSEGSKTEVSCYKHDLVTVVEIALKDTSTPHLVEEYVRDRISAVTQGSMGAHSGGYIARQMNVAEELRVRGVIT